MSVHGLPKTFRSQNADRGVKSHYVNLNIIWYAAWHPNAYGQWQSQNPMGDVTKC